jgi:hypothetical protein
MRNTIALVLLSTLTPAPGSSSQAEKAQPVPAWVTSNWETLIGTWIADNQAYKSATDSMDAYGIEWSWGLGKKSLVGRLYGIREGKEVGTFWEFREFWHPGEGRLIATQYASDGTYGAGPHELKDDGETEMLQTFFDPTTGAVFRVGHRSKLEGDVHATRSFDVDADGEWKDRRAYLWRRKR